MKINDSSYMASILFFFLFIINILSAKYSHKIKVEWGDASPDGVNRKVILINGKFKGRVLRVNKGDKLEFEYLNKLKGEVSDLHCHGLHQKKTLLSDGVGYISQCPPLEGESFFYKINLAKQTGTYFCHSHTGTQLIDGLGFPLIIDDPNDCYLKPFNSWLDRRFSKKFKGEKNSESLFYVDHTNADKEIDSVIDLTDWHHELGKLLFETFLNGNGDEPTPDSALINGKGNYFCKSPPNNCESMYNTKLIYGKAKRFRIINSSTMAVFHFSIYRHKLHLIECDGITLDGKTVVEVLRLNAAQRCSFIVKGDQSPGNYWIRAQMDPTIYPSPPSTEWQPNVFGILSYSDSNGNILSNKKPTEYQFNKMQNAIDDSISYGSTKNLDIYVTPNKMMYKPPPERADQTYLMEINMIMENNHPLFGFNNIINDMPPTTTLLSLILDKRDYTTPRITPYGTYRGYNPKEMTLGKVYDYVFINSDPGQHPMHMHGHQCWVMYQGLVNSGSTNYEFSYDENAPLRDVATVNPNAALVFRCIADNPGVWPFHCHIAWHLEAGLMFNMVEDNHYIRKEYGKVADIVRNCKFYDSMNMSMMSNDNIKHDTHS
jgi:FtsP/CotA-like multicopper oxidase with cupredoxin domain